ISQTSAPRAAARATAVVSDPPRPSVVTSREVETPWNPATITTLPSARASLIRPGRTAGGGGVGDPPGAGDQVVSGVPHGRHDDHDVVPGVPGGDHTLGDPADPRCVPHRGAAVLLDDQGHGVPCTSWRRAGPAYQPTADRPAPKRNRNRTATRSAGWWTVPVGRRGERRAGWLDRHLAAAGEGAAQGDLVGVFEVAADGEATGDAGDPDAEGGQEAGQVHGGGLALDVGVGGQDDLAGGGGLQAAQQLADAQVVRADALDRADGPAEDVVAAAELLGPLDRNQVTGLLDHADQAGVAPRVLADAAQVALGHVPADPAEVHPGLDLGDGPGQALGVGRLDLQDVEGQPLGALGTDPGQPPELVDQVLDGAFVHRLRSPGRVAAPCPGWCRPGARRPGPWPCAGPR